MLERRSDTDATFGAKAAKRQDGWWKWSLDRETEMLERQSDTAATGDKASAERRNCKSGGEAQRLRVVLLYSSCRASGERRKCLSGGVTLLLLVVRGGAARAAE
jgi:hypothetical protein